MTDEDDSGLVKHARRELELIGEEPEAVEWYCRVIREFASFGHSGGSAAVTTPVLHELLQWHPLSPITSDPAEWIDQSEASGHPLWQNRRDSRCFSENGGKTWKRIGDGADMGMWSMTLSITGGGIELIEVTGDVPPGEIRVRGSDDGNCVVLEAKQRDEHGRFVNTAHHERDRAEEELHDLEGHADEAIAIVAD